jgi:hypothetical protein
MNKNDNFNNDTPIVDSNFKNIVFCDLSSDDCTYSDDISSCNLPKYHRNLFINTDFDKNNSLLLNDYASLINDIVQEINNIKKEINYLKSNIKPVTPFNVVDKDLKTNKKKCSIM